MGVLLDPPSPLSCMPGLMGGCTSGAGPDAPATLERRRRANADRRCARLPLAISQETKEQTNVRIRAERKEKRSKSARQRYSMMLQAQVTLKSHKRLSVALVVLTRLVLVLTIY